MQVQNSAHELGAVLMSSSALLGSTWGSKAPARLRQRPRSMKPTCLQGPFGVHLILLLLVLGSWLQLRFSNIRFRSIRNLKLGPNLWHNIHQAGWEVYRGCILDWKSIANLYQDRQKLCSLV